MKSFLFKYYKAFFTLFISILINGCATANFNTPQPVHSDAAEIKSIYIYSFLDIREREIGTKFMEEFHRQLEQAMVKGGVLSQQYRIKQSPALTTYGDTVRIPIRAAIAENAAAESASGASHRLLVLPVAADGNNATANFTIRWELYNIKTAQREWLSTSKSHHLNWWRGDENPAERAKILIDALTSEMLKSGLIKKPAP